MTSVILLARLRVLEATGGCCRADVDGSMGVESRRSTLRRLLISTKGDNNNEPASALCAWLRVSGGPLRDALDSASSAEDSSRRVFEYS